MSISLDNAIWLAGIFTEAALVVLLSYRHIWRTLPIFCSFCVWDVLSNIGAFVISQSHAIDPHVYFHVYFWETIISSILEFCVLVELGWSVLRPVRASLPRIALFVVGGLLLAAGAVIWPFAAVQGIAQASKQALLLAQIQHTVSILRILFFLLLAASSQLLSIGWRDRELQVATGLGFYSLVNVAVSIVQSRQSTAAQYTRLEEFVVVSFLCSLVYWVISFSQKEAERRAFTPQMQKVLLAMAGSARTARVALSDARSDKPPKRN